jgi:hypothetical protein
MSNTLPNMPVFNTGASATIISPGQNTPPMTGYYPPSAAQNPYAPGAYPNAGQPGPQGAYQQPGAYPNGAPVLVPSGAGSDMGMLGGATTIDTRTQRPVLDGLWSNPLFWPFAIAAWPFVKIDEALNPTPSRSSGSYGSSGYPGGAPGMTGTPAASGIPIKQQMQAAHEQAQVQAMERQLAMQRAGGGEAAAGAAPASAGAAPPPLSIADELAALRNRNATAPGAAQPGDSAAGVAAAPGPGGWTTLKTEDRDGDHRPDRWVQQNQAGRKRELLDDDHDGRPEKTVYFEPGSDKIARIEEDADGDGQPDAWTLYKDGQIVARRADTNHDGEVDSWTFYRDGQVVRQEQDTDGDGVRDRVDFYENGKLVRRTEDKDGDGHPERITLFDAKGNPAELDEDKNGDGKIDVRSYYTGGKLTRRELLDESQAVQ